tara:strand:- start:314 stop:1087 length:774 start_codon:yes stop_codon:yes gene_type:complete
MSLTGKSPAETYKDITYVDNSNNGVTTTLKSLKTGEGSSTALQVSDRSLLVKSATNNTTALDVQNASGSSKLLVDTTNNYVKANGVHVNTQYQSFSLSSGHSAMTSNNHWAIPIDALFTGALATIGTGDDPDTSVSFTGSTQRIVNSYWHVMDNITIDRVVWWSAADTGTGDTTRCHLMSYDVNTDNDADGGNLSNGVVLADGDDIVNAGDEQLYYQQMTIQSADVSAGKIILFAFRPDSVNSDYGLQVTVKYHITG